MAGVRSPVDAWLVDAPNLPLLATRDLWTVPELASAYNNSGNGRHAIAQNVFAMHLEKRFRRVGLTQTAYGRCQVYAIREAARWQAATEAARSEHVQKAPAKL